MKKRFKLGLVFSFDRFISNPKTFTSVLGKKKWVNKKVFRSKALKPYFSSHYGGQNLDKIQ